MPITVEWCIKNPNTVYQRYENQWSLEQQRLSLKQTAEMVLSRLPAIVHVVMDMRDTVYMPGKLMLNSRALEQAIQRNTGQIILVQPSKAMVALLNATKRFTPKTTERLHFAKSIKEAQAIIQQANASASH